jgi:hypothetical protein
MKIPKKSKKSRGMKMPENLKNNRGVIDLARAELIFEGDRCYIIGPLIKPPIINIPGIIVGKHNGEDWAIQGFGKPPSWAMWE